jgi:hypothetical protein
MVEPQHQKLQKIGKIQPKPSFWFVGRSASVKKVVLEQVLELFSFRA